MICDKEIRDELQDMGEPICKFCYKQLIKQYKNRIMLR